ncbi:hypothetical protein [Phenylobacterium sp.]|jgi:hypothetical protein|uniref:terminase small subunit-like protein n=1 Tax=Phenylobacterium sp. TaxID=1871053 RepID=UPI002F92E60E
MDDETDPPAGAEAARTPVRRSERPVLRPDGRAPRPGPKVYSARLARRVCARLAAGESLTAICAEADMPHRATLARWAKAQPRFAEMLARARTAGARSGRSAQRSSYDPAVAFEICERLAEGESLAEICRHPAMPTLSSVYRWRRTDGEFAEMMREAREVQAERFCDLGWAIASGVTPETAFATRVKLEQLRWTAGVLNPHRFRTKPAEAEARPKTETFVIRTFMLQVREDGAQRVVATEPDPVSGLPVWSTRGPWSLPVTPEQARAYEKRAEGEERLRVDDPRAVVTCPPEPGHGAG